MASIEPGYFVHQEASLSVSTTWTRLFQGKGKALLLALVISAGAMWLALMNVSMEGLSKAIAQSDPLCLLGVAILFMTQQVIRAWRQAVIIRTQHPTHSLKESFGALCVGFFFINSLPLRVGEVVRPLILQERDQIPLGHGFAMVFSERVIDLAAMLIMIGAVAWVVDVPSHHIALNAFGIDESIDWVTMGKWAILIAIVLVLVAGAVVILAGRALLNRMMEWANHRSARVQHVAARIQVFGNEFIPAVEALRRPKTMMQVVALSVLTWVLTGCMYPLLAAGFGLEGFVGYGEGIAILAFTMMGMTLPSVFSFAGTYEAALY